MNSQFPEEISATREDALINGQVRILQPLKGYRAAIDPILLAACVDASPGTTVLDVGSGTGAASLCLAFRRPDLAIWGLERNPIYADLARQSVNLNGWSTRINLLNGDLRCPPGDLPMAFDVVMTNPPYHTEGTRSPHAGKQAADFEGHNFGLRDWFQACLNLMSSRGRLFTVLPAERLDGLLATLHGKTGDVRILPCWPRAGTPANRVLVSARKAVKGGARLLPGLVLHQDDSPTYTPEANRILRAGNALDLQLKGRR